MQPAACAPEVSATSAPTAALDSASNLTLELDALPALAEMSHKIPFSAVVLPVFFLGVVASTVSLTCPALHAQSIVPLSPAPGISREDNPLAAPEPASIRTTREKWVHFVRETASPFTLGAGAFNALFSQATHTDPQYGSDGTALAERYGASVADIASQNFFGDFVVASVFHEDPRYFRKGEGHGLVYRAGYAISRALVIRRDTGGNTFNFDNVLGSAMSAGFSNLYYPPPSRTRTAILMHFWIDVADNGFVNLAPEFWPDFRRKVFGRHRRDRF